MCIYIYMKIFAFPAVSTQERYTVTGKYSMDGKRKEDSGKKDSSLLRHCELTHWRANKLKGTTATDWAYVRAAWFGLQGSGAQKQTVVIESCRHLFAHRSNRATVRRTELNPSAPLCSGLLEHVTHMVTCRGHYFLSLSAVKDTEAQHYHNLSCRTESYCGWAEGSGQTIPEKITMLNVQCNWWMDNVVISFILFV